MSKSLTAINIIWAIADALVCALTILALTWGARYFDKWWLLLVEILPVALYHQHSLIINTDLTEARESENDTRH